ncbi:site-specific recombinase [Psychrobacter cryohalolentis]|uniref:Site-specific recombinase n=1 Tax=Psychrobacter cryohalolentis (strain ATCC BAA-1226 / DSM 17306 / VKM B-2378 / K5) TaxID=335284 RepID=Q1QAS0_PSYCK|nr:site-specific recombinase [Psychrobacter cryohalolentis]ABE75233.1 putative site-specific recombinase [Psychrobacter cryohalolentis K5]ASE25427.1 recombinase [Psychrobacter cryohalolentis]
MSEIKHILQQITALSDVPDPAVLKRLIDELRVSDKEPTLANQNIQNLIEVLRQHPEYGDGLSSFVLKLIIEYRQIALYTDTGIMSDQGFFYSLRRLIGHRFLPLLPQEDSVVELVGYLFDKRSDERWLAHIEKEKWDELVGLLKVHEQHLNLVATAKNSILNAIIILSYRISGIGLHPDLMESYPQMLNYSASFVAQNQEAVLYVNQYREAHELDTLTDIIPEKAVDPAPLLVMIEQCEDIVATIRKRIYKTGISIRLTNMMLRLDQSLQRMRILTELVANNYDKRDRAIIELIQALITTASHRYSIGYLIDNNTKLLSRKVTENASRVGEHYISTDKSGYQKMFKKASIGGFIIAFMATTKILAYHLALAPMGRAFVNSMIYGLGFVFIHIVHGTVATKQPAMTAAAIASTISDSSGKKSHQLNKLSELVVDILRTQFIAIMGNIMMAIPVALIISFAWLQYTGAPMIDTDKAAHLLHDLDPFRSLALPHAAIAGVYLFLSGLIAGYYDNLAVYNQIGARIQRHKLLQYLLPKAWLQRLGGFIEANLGAIMGNFIFGVFLGSTATIGFLFGLPIDIRHIAFASANLAHGLFNMSSNQLEWQVVLLSVFGVLLIGMVNLIVSFSLALLVALRSKEVKFVDWSRLTKQLFSHLMTHPSDFFWPRDKPMKYARIDSQGQMIFDDTASQNSNQPLPKNYVVRRLSDVKVLPKALQKKIEGQQAVTDIHYTNPSAEHQLSPELNNREAHITVNKPAIHKTIELDDGLTEEALSSVPYSQDIQYGKTHAAFDENNQTVSDAISQDSTADNKVAGDAKTPLPKPKKPPNLPS